MERGAKRIVISAEESYTYFGKVIDGLRQGRGRTQMQNGCTAYEGDYLDDKRDGFGAYYYKSGKICYMLLAVRSAILIPQMLMMRMLVQ